MEPITILRERDFLKIIARLWEFYKEYGTESTESMNIFIFDSLLRELFKNYDFDLKYDMANDKWIITHKHEDG